MKSFSLRSSVSDLRVNLCKVAYLLGLQELVDDGQITETEARDRFEIAVNNIATYRLTLKDHPIQFSVLGVDKSVIL